MATSFPRVVRKLTNSLAASETKNVDTVPMSSFTQLDYMVNVTNAAGDKVFTAVVLVQKLMGNVQHTVSNKYGNMQISVNPKVTGGDFSLELINSQAESLQVTLARTLI